jgi:acetoacetyl-CoA synthetase
MRQTAPPVLWQPAPDARETTDMGRWLDWLERERGLRFDGYADVWRWSTTDLDAFWRSVWDYYRVGPPVPPGAGLQGTGIADATWFPDVELNFAEHMLRLDGRGEDDAVVVAISQSREPMELSVRQLRAQVADVRAGLASLGVGPGDRVAAYVSNIPEALVAFLATVGLGAIWSSCSPELGVRSVRERFGQIEPRVLLAVDGYRYGRKVIDRTAAVAEIRAALPSVEHTVVIPHLGAAGSVPGALDWAGLMTGAPPVAAVPVPFDHPLAILYSSGTTGPPKAIVHRHGGLLLEHLKLLGLHTDLGPSDRFFWLTTTSWMMWNYLTSGLLVGSTVVLFDGDPGRPDLGALWRLAAETGVTYFGAGAPYFMACRTAGLEPGRSADLSRLRGVGSTAAPLPASGFEWLDRAVAPGLAIGSVSGGTDVCTGFVGPSPLVPVWSGEISCRMLGAAIAAYDEQGTAVVGARGELVIEQPLPSMPLGFWGDTDGARYRAAYLERYPGVWHHGDWITITERGSCLISGRSDATLNRGGVRLGSSDFYSVAEELPEIADSLVVHLDDPEGGPGELLLFVVLAAGAGLDEALRKRLAGRLRAELSPRHVPDAVIAVRAIPRTFSGKKLEVPVKRILQGEAPGQVAAPGALVDPTALDDFVDIARRPR